MQALEIISYELLITCLLIAYKYAKNIIKNHSKNDISILAMVNLILSLSKNYSEFC